LFLILILHNLVGPTASRLHHSVEFGIPGCDPPKSGALAGIVYTVYTG